LILQLDIEGHPNGSNAEAFSRPTHADGEVAVSLTNPMQRKAGL